MGSFGPLIEDGAFMDYHHGVLMPEQLEMLALLLPRCPALRVVTYEDPRFDDDGLLRPDAVGPFEALKEMVARWAAVIRGCWDMR